MIRVVSGLGLVMFLATACQVPNPSAEDGRRPPSAQPDLIPPESGAATGGSDVNSQEPVADRAEDPQEPVMASEPTVLTETVRAIWQEPAFQRQLAEGYLRGSEADPALTQREAQFRLEVLTLIGDGRLEDAMSRLKSLQGDNAVFDLMLGKVMLGQDKFKEAAVEFTKAVARKSNYRRAWESLAFAQLRNEQLPAARDALVRVISLGGGNAMVYGSLGMIHAKMSDFVAAESAFRQVIMLDPEREAWRTLLASTVAGQGRFAEGASLYGALLDQDPDRVDLWLDQAKLLVEMKDSKRAAANLEIVEQLGGSTYESLLLLGNLYFNDGLYGLAVDAYERAITKGAGKSHRPLLDVAYRMDARAAHVEGRRLTSAIEAAYGAQLDVDARKELLRLQARLAVANGATEEQIEILKRIVEESPLDGAALIQLGQHYQGAGENEKAILRYEQAAGSPKFAAEAKVLHAQLLVQQDRFADALPLLRQAQEIKRRDDVANLIEYVQRSVSSGK